MTDEDHQDEQNSNITLEQLQADLDSMTSNWKRALADFENYKRQKEKESKELLEFAKEVTVVKLLPTIDALEQGLKHAPQEGNDSYKNWLTGINGIVVQLDKVLGELGVKKIEAIGKKFDPNFHEAVKEQESEQDDGIVLDEFQSGFELNGKVIRPSQVIISKKNNQ